MKLINPSVEYLPQALGLRGIYKQIELVGRTCYKSQDKITETSAKPFVKKMIGAHHFSMLEHATVYLEVPSYTIYKPIIDRYKKNPYSKVVYDVHQICHYITTNYRVLVENEWLNDFQFISNNIKNHKKRISLKFTTSIGVSRECNRHRSFSIAEQSTRYCNYSKEKFGSELTFVIPSWLDIKEGHCDKKQYTNDTYYKDYSPKYTFMKTLFEAEDSYLQLISDGWKPQQAREILPLSTATEVVYTAFEDDWRHFFDLRLRGTTGQPHPNAKQVAAIAHDLIFNKLNLDL